MKADQLNEKFDKADWDENESHNLHTENAVELAHAFGTREEVEAMERIADQHMRRGHILPHEIEERSALMKKYYNMLENETNPTVRSKMEGYKVMPPMDSKYVARKGLEGPFTTLSGKVVYYDPKEGKYYDPDTDIYLTYDEFRQYDNDYSGIKGEKADDFIDDIAPKETNEWVQDSPAQGFSGQERNFIQELCLRMDGVSKTPNGLQWQGKSKTWDEGNVLSDKGKLTTVMLWAKKNIDDLYHKMGSEFQVYSDGNDEGDSGRGQSDGNQIIQNIINKVGKIGEETVKGPRGHLSSIVADDLNEIDCWDGYKKDGTKPGTGKNKDKRVNNCVKEDAGQLADIAAMAAVAGLAYPVMAAMIKGVFTTGKGIMKLKQLADEAGVKLADTILPQQKQELEIDEGKYVSDAQRKAVHASKAEGK